MKKILLMLLIFTCACSIRHSLSSEIFQDKMENKSFTVQDTTEISDAEFIKKELVALKKEYQIYYFESPTEEKGKQLYNINKSNIINNNKVNIDEKNSSNFDRLKATNKKKVFYTVRIGNTVIYVEAEIKYKNEIKNILKDIGYY